MCTLLFYAGPGHPPALGFCFMKKKIQSIPHFKKLRALTGVSRWKRAPGDSLNHRCRWLPASAHDERLKSPLLKRIKVHLKFDRKGCCPSVSAQGTHRMHFSVWQQQRLTTRQLVFKSFFQSWALFRHIKKNQFWKSVSKRRDTCVLWQKWHLNHSGY